MLAIYVDTSLLAVPNFAVSEDAALRLVERVNGLAELVAPEIPIDVHVASNLEETLWSLGLEPDFSQIGQFLDLMGISHVFSAADIARIYSLILERAGRGEDAGLVEARGFDAFSSEPDLPEGLTPLDLRTQTKLSLLTTSLRDHGDDLWYMASAFEDACDLHFNVIGKGVVVSHMPNEAGDFLISDFAGRAAAVSSVDFIRAPRFWELVWASASDERDLALAIALEALAIRRVSGLPSTFEELPWFSLGSEFLDSLRGHECLRDGRFSSACRSLCANIVAGTSHHKTRKFGPVAQVERGEDSAKGWRVHLTKGAQGLRLMYWQTDKGIEFANVGVKHALSIEMGALNGRTEIDLSKIC